VLKTPGVTRLVTPARGIVGASFTKEVAMTDRVTMYLSEADDAIERLAQLDSARRPTGPVLVAAVGGEPVAAVPLDGGPAIADRSSGRRHSCPCSNCVPPRCAVARAQGALPA
jgi:hypothetical protein